MEIIFKQSKNWWQSKDLNWFIENAEFSFTHNHRGKWAAIRVVTKEKLNGMNCFQFDNDEYGVIINSECEFNPDYFNPIIIEKTTDVTTMLVKFLKGWGAGEFINPKMNLNHIINTIKRNHKLIKIKNKL